MRKKTTDITMYDYDIMDMDMDFILRSFFLKKSTWFEVNYILSAYLMHYILLSLDDSLFTTKMSKH